ncbi:phosphoadenosine phosphosulfate reductase [Vibrio phage 159E36-2a]
MTTSNTVTVVISVSGGRTSAYMAEWCSNNRDAIARHLNVEPDCLRLLFIFANTGLEHDDTLRFMHDVDRLHLNNEVVWLESVFDQRQGKGVKHRVVTYDTAYQFNQWWDRNHPFHAYVRKHGVPNVKFKSCTRELKLRVIRSYLREQGFKSGTDYWTAIGIRTDETRRVSKNADAEKIFYPLVDINPVDKEDVLMFWEDFEHDLNIPEHQGNCLTCFKKSFKKQMTLWQEMPEIWDMVKFMESEYGMIGA